MATFWSVSSAWPRRPCNAAAASARLNLFQEMGLLQAFHLESWRKGNEHYRVLQPWIQVGPEKFQKAIRHFQEWVKQRGLRPVEAPHVRRGPGGIEPLCVTEDGDPAWEKFFRTSYTPADWPEQKTARLTQAILRRHPGCPSDEGRRIAEPTGRRRSGRVGRSAAGRVLDASAVDLAVTAHIRHAHTNYDELLMRGTKRLDARAQVRAGIDRVLAEWSGV
jgi:hypothetical protein